MQYITIIFLTVILQWGANSKMLKTDRFSSEEAHWTRNTTNKGKHFDNYRPHRRETSAIKQKSNKIQKELGIPVAIIMDTDITPKEPSVNIQRLERDELRQNGRMNSKGELKNLLTASLEKFSTATVPPKIEILSKNARNIEKSKTKTGILDPELDNKVNFERIRSTIFDSDSSKIITAIGLDSPSDVENTDGKKKNTRTQRRRKWKRGSRRSRKSSKTKSVKSRKTKTEKPDVLENTEINSARTLKLTQENKLPERPENPTEETIIEKPKSEKSRSKNARVENNMDNNWNISPVNGEDEVGDLITIPQTSDNNSDYSNKHFKENHHYSFQRESKNFSKIDSKSSTTKFLTKQNKNQTMKTNSNLNDIRMRDKDQENSIDTLNLLDEKLKLNVPNNVLEAFIREYNRKNKSQLKENNLKLSDLDSLNFAQDAAKYPYVGGWPSSRNSEIQKAENTEHRDSSTTSKDFDKGEGLISKIEDKIENQKTVMKEKQKENLGKKKQRENPSEMSSTEMPIITSLPEQNHANQSEISIEEVHSVERKIDEKDTNQNSGEKLQETQFENDTKSDEINEFIKDNNDSWILKDSLIPNATLTERKHLRNYPHTTLVHPQYFTPNFGSNPNTYPPTNFQPPQFMNPYEVTPNFYGPYQNPREPIIANKNMFSFQHPQELNYPTPNDLSQNQMQNYWKLQDRPLDRDMIQKLESQKKWKIDKNKIFYYPSGVIIDSTQSNNPILFFPKIQNLCTNCSDFSKVNNVKKDKEKLFENFKDINKGCLMMAAVIGIEISKNQTVCDDDIFNSMSENLAMKGLVRNMSAENQSETMTERNTWNPILAKDNGWFEQCKNDSWLFDDRKLEGPGLFETESSLFSENPVWNGLPPSYDCCFGDVLNNFCGALPNTFSKNPPLIYAPWVAALLAKTKNKFTYKDCGVTLISNQHAITSAECVLQSNTQPLYILTGSRKLKYWSEKDLRKVLSVSLVEDMKLAVLVFDELKFEEHIRPICLEVPQKTDDYTTMATVGWDAAFLSSRKNARYAVPKEERKHNQIAIMRKVFCDHLNSNDTFCMKFISNDMNHKPWDLTKKDIKKGSPLIFEKDNVWYLKGIMLEETRDSGTILQFTDLTKYLYYLDEIVQIIT